MLAASRLREKNHINHFLKYPVVSHLKESTKRATLSFRSGIGEYGRRLRGSSNLLRIIFFEINPDRSLGMHSNYILVTLFGLFFFFFFCNLYVLSLRSRGIPNPYRVVLGTSADGQFTLKSAYSLIPPQPKDLMQDVWKRIWKLQVPQRLRMFVWLLTHGKVMTNSKRYKRGFITNPCCCWCHNMEEDLNHVFQSCPKAVAFWAKLKETNHSSPSSHSTFREWLVWNIQPRRE